MPEKKKTKEEKKTWQTRLEESREKVLPRFLSALAMVAGF